MVPLCIRHARSRGTCWGKAPNGSCHSQPLPCSSTGATHWLSALSLAPFAMQSWARYACGCATLHHGYRRQARLTHARTMVQVLKRILRQERPDGAPLADPGMPSSHAMSLFFLSGYLCAAIVAWTPTWSQLQRLAASTGLLGFAVSSVAWRVSSGLHTTLQVLVGSVLGGFNGVLWLRFSAAHMDWLQRLDSALSSNGALPSAAIVGVLLAGALIVGSVERRLLGSRRRPSQRRR